jgi:NTP pyrophosphatase (non-canonical NTP hydrolase)
MNEFNNYQKKTRQTAKYHEQCKKMNIPLWIYPALGLAGETGEVVEKIKKIIRDNEGTIPAETYELLIKEMGDVLWYLARLSDEFGISLSTIAKKNLEKLLDRKKRNTIHGSGDKR